MPEQRTDKLNGVVTRAFLIERPGRGSTESGHVAEPVLHYADGKILTLRAQSCGCCGGSEWDKVETIEQVFA